jgi:hypothetical protein
VKRPDRALAQHVADTDHVDFLADARAILTQRRAEDFGCALAVERGRLGVGIRRTRQKWPELVIRDLPDVTARHVARAEARGMTERIEHAHAQRRRLEIDQGAPR